MLTIWATLLPIALFVPPSDNRPVAVGLRLVRPEAAFPAFAREPGDVLGALIRNTREAADGPLLIVSQRDVTAGNSLVATLQGAAGGSVTLDLFRLGDTVEHLPTQAATTDGGDLRVPIDVPRSATAGPRVLIAVVSSAKLGSRPPMEKASTYLATLREDVAAGTAVRADMALFDVHAAPVAVTVTKKQASPSRCAGILSRAQLGEDMSEADRAFLRAECR